MHYMTLSFTHKNTDISVREKLSFSNSDRLRTILELISQNQDINEVVVLSTCNRVEIITSTKDCDSAKEHVLHQIVKTCNVSYEDIAVRADAYEDESAIFHLFSVAASLDSLVIGETQIVGQLKDAYRFAYECGFCGVKLSRAMHHAFKCAANVRTQTSISQSPISVSSVAVSKAKEIAGKFDGEEVLVVGAGEMSALAAKHLLASGATVVLINRTPARAYALASTLEGDVRVEEHANLKEYLHRCRFIFSATSSPVPVITDDMILSKETPRYFFDIAVPRDIELSERRNISVYAVDDLKEIVAQNMALRENQAQVAYSIVGSSTKEFYVWLKTLGVDPLIKEIREKARICAINEVEKAHKKGYIAKDSKDEVLRVVHQVFNSFLHAPTKNLKVVNEQSNPSDILDSIKYFFDIEDENEKLDMES